jgi:DIS3-like exonuclease 2
VQEKGLALLSPKDSKIPRVVIPIADCPPDYVQEHRKYENTLFIGRILSWERDSPFASGELMRSVGEAGEIEPETESFLVENDIEFGDFPPEALECLPRQTPWTIPQEEVGRRRDFRKECVFTIDPETARDLDDALHVKEMENDVYEVGVHIADVSYFVKAGSALDEAAGRRATSVYLVQRVVPMLPRLLCEQLCSLNPNEDRLAVSVVWKLTPDGKFVDEWMGRSIIRSCAKLSYAHAQAMIDEPSRLWSKDDLPRITNGFTPDQVSRAVSILNKLAKGLKGQRESKGTLRLNQVHMPPTSLYSFRNIQSLILPPSNHWTQTEKRTDFY